MKNQFTQRAILSGLLAILIALGFNGAAQAHSGGGGGGHGGGGGGHFSGGGHFGGGGHFAGGGYRGGYGANSGYGGYRGGYGSRGGYGGYRGGYGWRGGYGGYRGGYGWHGGWGGWGWGGLGIGLYFATLPYYYSTIWYAGIPYYYADDNYYQWDSTVGQYETVAPPAEVQHQAEQQSANLIAYPKNGQTEAQQAADKSECSAWAISQSGFDPTQTPTASTTKHSDYMRAQAACLEGRGYSVQ
jgi:hypothetical protein